MKKLLTMMVSCASALFAMADGTWSSGTDFQGYGAVEGGPAIPLNINKDDTGEDGVRYWYSKTSTDGIVEAAVTNNGTTAYLMLDTSEVLERTIGGYTTANDVVTFESKSLSDGAVYFDSKVQFTATEDNVTPSEGDKLVVWLKAVETEMDGEAVVTSGYTNLMITAGLGEDNLNHAIPTNFVASGVTIEPNSWHQLTIRAFVKEDNRTYFNVYIDGDPVTGILEGDNSVTKTDFESLVSNADTDLNPTTITSVGFRGTGAVDEVYFYDSNPLVQTFPLTITAPENCTIAGCLVNGEVIDSESNTYLVDVKAENVVVAVEVPAGYTVTNEGATFEDETWFIPVDITDAIANTPFSFTVTVEATEEPELPTVEPAVGENGVPVETKEPYSDAAKTCLTTYFPKGTGTPENPIKLQVVVNGKTLLGDDAVKAINDVAAKFGGDPFDANGTLEVVFKVDDVMKALEGAADGYTLTVGEATLKNTYKVAPKFINLADPEVEIEEPGAGATEKFFKLVIKPVTE